MESSYSDRDRMRVLQTLESIKDTLEQLIDWNKEIVTVDDYYASQGGMQLLAANCALITAIGEGINRINRIVPDFLSSNFPEIPWPAIVGMRNHIAHGYFELDADMIFEAVNVDIRPLYKVIQDAIQILEV